MNTDEWHRIEELLDTALELAPPERRAFLERLDTDAPEMRREVESLLACAAQADGFLGTSAVAFASDFFADPEEGHALIGQIIGHYRILREIGRGGMGAVFLAERSDGAFEQQVALKIVRRSITPADAELGRRFRRERQILASLNHPNIARLLDGGVSAEGEPFLAMEYVEGARIDDYCHRFRLTIDQRLQLFLRVCQAVADAHRHLIVHRDIKPSNILVTTEGVPKLLDFGIAKLLAVEEAGEQTQTNLRVFTPQYASPEQIAGEAVTTATDVYSLGVLLNELLPDSAALPRSKAAARWHEQTTLPERQTAANVAVAATGKIYRTTLNGHKPLNIELRRIIEMARREEPARRYGSVAQFADDIQRYLDGLPVRAQKDSFRYRAGKFVQRHRAGMAAAAIVLLSLIVGIVATAWQARRAEANRIRAEKRFNDVRRLSNALLFEITPKIERLQGATEAREILVKRALEYLDSLAQESADDLQLQSELAAAYEKIGDLQGAPGKPNLSDFSGALSSLEKAQAMRLHLSQTSPNDADNQKRRAANFAAASYIRWWTSDVSGAIRDSEKALEIYDRLIAENSALTELRVAAADTRINLAQTYYFNDQVAETYPPLLKAVGELETLRQTNADDIEVSRLLGKGYCLLGMNLFWDNKSAEGEVEINKALATAESLAAKYPNDNVVNQGLWHVYIQSTQFYQDSNSAQSFEYLKKALKVVEESVKNDPFNTQARQNLAKTYSQLGSISIRLKKLDDALAYLEKSLTVFIGLEKAEPKNLTYKDDIGRNFAQFGLAKHQQGNYSAALVVYEKAAEVFELQAADPKNIFPRRQLANVYHYIADTHGELENISVGAERQKHRQAAKENYRRALDILLQLDAQNALAEYDRKFLAEMKSAAQKYQ